MSIYLSDFLERGGELPKVVEHNCEAIRQLDLYTQGARETARLALSMLSLSGVAEARAR